MIMKKINPERLAPFNKAFTNSIGTSPERFSNLPTNEESLSLFQNHYWTIRYHGHAASLRSTLGLHYLAVLLRHPEREFHVRELVARPMDVSPPAAAVAAPLRTRNLRNNTAGAATSRFVRLKL